MMQQPKDRTYCTIVECVEDLSRRINNMCNIQPKIFLRFNQNTEIIGSAVLAYCIPDMHIELDIPHNYTLGKTHKTILTCVLVHEYCHYIESLSMSGRERNNAISMYNNQKYRRTEEQRNWTATKRLAKKLGLWNWLFYIAVCNYYYTTALQF